MRLNKIKGAVLTSFIVLSVGVIAVKAAPVSSKQKDTSTAQPTQVMSVTTTPTKVLAVTPVESSEENQTTEVSDTISKITPVVVSSTKYKEVTLLSKSDIEEMTGFEFTARNITSIHKQLKKASTWKNIGYSAADSKLIANRFTKSYNQSIGILKKLYKVDNLNLKIVVIDKPSYQNASIGVSGYNADLEGSKPNETNPGTTPSIPETTQSSLKELEISIDYKNGEVELEYEIKLDGTIKAQYQNDFTGEDLQAKDAQVKIENILTGLDVMESNQTIIENHILNKLNLAKDYKQFQYEAEFYDGKEIEFEK